MRNQDNRSKQNYKKKLSEREIEQDRAETMKMFNGRCGQVHVGNSIRWLDRTVVNGRVVQRLLTKSDFEQAYAGVFTYDDDGNPIPAVRWWRSRPERMVYEEVVFDPGRFFQDNGRAVHLYDTAEPARAALNLFTGWAKKPNDVGSCDLFYAHLRDNYCGGDPDTLETVLNWMAHVFQRPGKPIGWALAVVGDMGSGKSIVSDVLAEIIGRQYAPVFTTPDQLLGKFNAALGQCVLARVEEAFNPRDPRHVATLKNLLSGGDTLLELKGVDPVPIPLRANYIFTSNNDHFLTASSQGERRYFAFRCGNGAQQDGRYFAAIKRQMEAGGYSKLLHDLLARDISLVDFTSPPRTAVLSAQIRGSLTGLDRWWADCLEAGELIFAREPDTSEPVAWDDAGDRFEPPKALVVESAASYARDYAGRAPTLASVGKFLSANAGASVIRSREHGQRIQRFALPPLDECRRLFVGSRPGLRIEEVGGEVATVEAANDAKVVALHPPRRQGRF
jgi:hypothetical protein